MTPLPNFHTKSILFTRNVPEGRRLSPPAAEKNGGFIQRDGVAVQELRGDVAAEGQDRLNLSAALEPAEPEMVGKFSDVF